MATMASDNIIDNPSDSAFDSAFDPAKGIRLDNLPPFARRLRDAADMVWEDGYNQPFLRELGQGTLKQERFAFYLLQDYRYLADYAKVHALALTKTNDPEVMRFMVNVQNAIFNVESSVHRKYMAGYGVSEEEMDRLYAVTGVEIPERLGKLRDMPVRFTDCVDRDAMLDYVKGALRQGMP